MNYVVGVSENKDRILILLGKLINNNLRDIIILYTDEKYLDYIEDNLIINYGEGFLESGKISFLENKRYDNKVTNELYIDPNSTDLKLEKIIQNYNLCKID